MVEITVFNAFLILILYSLHTSSQCSAVGRQHEQEHSGYVEDDLTAFKEDNSTLNCSSQVSSEQKIFRMPMMRAVYQSQEQGVTATKITVHGCGRN